MWTVSILLTGERNETEFIGIFARNFQRNGQTRHDHVDSIL